MSDSYTGAHGTYPLDVYCRESLAKYLDADEILTVTKQGFAYFEEQFGVAYPFAKYDQIFVPEFNAGAMENAGCVTIMEDYVFRSRVTDAAYEQRANTILHELAHMWFGDLVTMTWWDDLWLNESFAEWAAHWSQRQRHPVRRRVDDVREPAQGVGLPAGPAALDAPDRRRHGRPRRRARELRRHHVREGRLRPAAAGGLGRRGASSSPGVRNYFTKHAWGNTELRDLLSELEATSGRDLSEWTAAVAADQRRQPAAPAHHPRAPTAP